MRVGLARSKYGVKHFLLRHLPYRCEPGSAHSASTNDLLEAAGLEITPTVLTRIFMSYPCTGFILPVILNAEDDTQASGQHALSTCGLNHSGDS
jgi:hypothetical protein